MLWDLRVAVGLVFGVYTRPDALNGMTFEVVTEPVEVADGQYRLRA